MSAFFSSRSGLAPSFGAMAMPMLVPITICRPSMSYGRLTSSTIRDASWAHCSGRLTSVCTTANSSPPMRAMKLVDGTASIRRAATSLRSSSPIGWPSVSLTVLK